MSEKKSYPWIVMKETDAEKTGFVCTRCNNVHDIELPITIYEFDRLAMAFIELHKNCKEGK